MISTNTITYWKCSIENMLNQKSVTPKHLAKIPGELSSAQLVLGLIVRLFSGKIYHDIESRFSWLKTKAISKENEEEINNFGWKIKIYVTATHLNLDH